MHTNLDSQVRRNDPWLAVMAVGSLVLSGIFLLLVRGLALGAAGWFLGGLVRRKLAQAT
jgi:hypothetical protein